MKPGIRLLQCPSCEATKEVETGIKSMYHCGMEMVEIEGHEAEEQDETREQKIEEQHIRPGIRLLQCPACGRTKKVEAGIRTMFCCGTEMGKQTDWSKRDEEEDEPQAFTIRLKKRR